MCKLNSAAHCRVIMPHRQSRHFALWIAIPPDKIHFIGVYSLRSTIGQPQAPLAICLLTNYIDEA
jgi:hypothetical protein